MQINLILIGELSKLDKQTGVKFDKIKVPIERKPIYKQFFPAGWSAWFILMVLESCKTQHSYI